jgi:hypothetical protein
VSDAAGAEVASAAHSVTGTDHAAFSALRASAVLDDAQQDEAAANELESETESEDALSAAELAADAAASAAVKMAIRAGLVSNAAIAADARLDCAPSPPADDDAAESDSQADGGFLESSAERVSLRSKIAARVKPAAAKVRTGARKVTQKVRTGTQKVTQKASAAVKAVKARVAPKAAPSSAPAPPEAHTTLLGIVQAMYEVSLRAGQTHTFSFNRQCVQAVVIQTITVNQFLTWVLHVPALNAIVVVFRGTVNSANVKSDLDFVKTPCRLDSLDCGKVHRGFFTLYRDTRPQILAAIRGFLARRSAPIASIYVIGHSLGAAVALFGGLDMAHTFAASPATAALRVSVVAWGCPRVGDARWAAAFGPFLGRALSVVRYQHWRKFALFKQADPISLIPPAALGFSHVGAEVQIECKTCSSWVNVHRLREYRATFTRLQGHAPAQC